MIYLLILSIAVVIGLVVVLFIQAGAAEEARHSFAAERAAWNTERKQLIDRIIARHIGEVLAMEREETLRQRDPADRPERNERPLMEGLN